MSWDRGDTPAPAHHTTRRDATPSRAHQHTMSRHGLVHALIPRGVDILRSLGAHPPPSQLAPRTLTPCNARRHHPTSQLHMQAQGSRRQRRAGPPLQRGAGRGGAAWGRRAGGGGGGGGGAPPGRRCRPPPPPPPPPLRTCLQQPHIAAGEPRKRLALRHRGVVWARLQQGHAEGLAGRQHAGVQLDLRSGKGGERMDGWQAS